MECLRSIERATVKREVLAQLDDLGVLTQKNFHETYCRRSFGCS